jgi:hypothetical protein
MDAAIRILGSSSQQHLKQEYAYHKGFMYFLLGSAFVLMFLVIACMGCGPPIDADEAEHDFRYQVSDDDAACRAHEAYIAVVTGACAPHSAASFDADLSEEQKQLHAKRKQQKYLADFLKTPATRAAQYLDDNSIVGSTNTAAANAV